ncbi:MAG TPA: glycosyltransferase family 39 protein [Pirellulales bacterium]|nr:glycosyltransferase family 39 protein [Pirellulales bacterium]
MPPLTRNERLLLTAMTLGGLALRCEGLSELSLAHFDEGVLMSSAFDVRLKGLWQFTLAQPLQAPPLYPWLVGGLMWLTGIASPLIGVYASALFGSATVPLFFLLARRLFGNRVGLIAAGLLATSDLHIAFSRMALTEAALTFWFVLAMYALARLADAGPGVWGWAVAAGLATAAAWNTKYNGWMPLAIAATAWFLFAARYRLLIRHAVADETAVAGVAQPPPAVRWSPKATERQPRAAVPHFRIHARANDNHAGGLLWAGLLIATSIAVACYVPWYRYVERSFEGGYAAVHQNHLNYVGGLADWPGRAARLFVSLSAFRHLGWLLTLTGMLIVLGWLCATFGRENSRAPRLPMSAALIFGAMAAVAAAVLGADALCLLIATVAIVPVLIWGRREHVMWAVWLGAFVVLTPFYHPYTRLLVPAIPAAICLTLWLLSATFEYCAVLETQAAADAGGRVEFWRPSRGYAAAALVTGLAISLAAHPFGWLPTKELWRRWSTRQAYRAFNKVVREHTPLDAHILCQGMPIMPLYLERRWDSLGHVPFTAWIGHVPENHPCYLAVDFWGIYGEHHEAARQAITEHLDGLRPVGWIENDLNVVTLLDYLPPAQVAERISYEWAALRRSDHARRAVIIPADPRDEHANLIVLYAVDRGRL